MRAKAHWGYSDAQLEARQEDLRVLPTSARNTWVAEQDGVIVGFVELAAARPVGELDKLFVDPSAMGSGVGRALLERALDAARHRGLTALELDSDPQTAPFYLRMGAEQIGETPTADRDRALPRMRFEVVDEQAESPGRFAKFISLGRKRDR